jgi:hypothetical protein
MALFGAHHIFHVCGLRVKDKGCDSVVFMKDKKIDFSVP